MISLLKKLQQASVIDLTHSLTPQIPTWNGACGFNHNFIYDYQTDGLRAEIITAFASAGTHIDAPAHFFKGMQDIATYPADRFFLEGAIIDVRSQVKNNSAYFISADDLLQHEQQYGLLSPHTAVLINTGWHKLWHAPKEYRNEDQYGSMVFPGISTSAAELLLQRGVVLIGIDTLSPDGTNLSFPFHNLWLKQGNNIIENLNFPTKLPNRGTVIIILPQKIANGVESSVRIIALVESIYMDHC